MGKVKKITILDTEKSNVSTSHSGSFETVESSEQINGDVQPKKKGKKNKIKGGKKIKKNVPQQRKDEVLHQHSALDYLKVWKENRRIWKFEKLKQIWLLKNAFDRTKIPDSDFQTFAEYIAAAKGKAREGIEQRATKLVEVMEKRLEVLADGMEESELVKKHPELHVDKKSYKRARTLLQCFQDVQA